MELEIQYDTALKARVGFREMEKWAINLCKTVRPNFTIGQKQGRQFI
jgi:hypothetical protein